MPDGELLLRILHRVRARVQATGDPAAALAEVDQVSNRLGPAAPGIDGPWPALPLNQRAHGIAGESRQREPRAARDSSSVSNRTRFRAVPSALHPSPAFSTVLERLASNPPLPVRSPPFLSASASERTIDPNRTRETAPHAKPTSHRFSRPRVSVCSRVPGPRRPSRPLQLRDPCPRPGGRLAVLSLSLASRFPSTLEEASPEHRAVFRPMSRLAAPRTSPRLTRP